MSTVTRSQKSKINQKVDKGTKKNSYVEVLRETVANSDNLKNESDIINDMRNKLAKMDFEMNDLKDQLQAHRENETFLKNKIEFITRNNRNQQDLIKQLQETIEKLGDRTKMIATSTSTQTENKALSSIQSQTENISYKCNSKNKSNQNRVLLLGIQSQTENISYKCNSKNKSNQNRVLLLGDSHSRNMTHLLTKHISGNTVISTIFKPNAPLKHVIEDVENLTRSFTKNDVLVIMGGSNDNYSRFDFSLVDRLISETEH
ncbi:hypothetical protein QE152_g18109 [Popillia japonica]|uniref:Uncharacterized protein n=1 Tax=Popillia japonica TaxID=7064 RepID=A0AAW1L4D0_POPJA